MEKGISSTKVCQCGQKSIAGLKKGIALCKYHYHEYLYGRNWALYLANKAVCCVCKTQVTVHRSVYSGAPYCLKCFYGVSQDHEGYIKEKKS